MRANRIRCTSNLHQIGIGLCLYVDDFKAYPGYYDFSSSSSPVYISPGYRSNYWDSKVLAYVGGSVGVFLCPGQTGGANDVSKNWNNWMGHSSLPFPTWCTNNMCYGYNSSGSTPPGCKLGLSLMDDSAPGHPNWTLPESSVVVPADMIALADWDPSAYVYGGTNFPCVPAWSLFLYTFTGKRHAGGANVLFCDAHVEYASTSRWGAPRIWMPLVGRGNEPALQRWNNDHRPHPEAIWSHP